MNMLSEQLIQMADGCNFALKTVKDREEFGLERARGESTRQDELEIRVRELNGIIGFLEGYMGEHAKTLRRMAEATHGHD